MTDYLYYTGTQLTALKALKTEASHSGLWSTISTWTDAHINDACPADFSGEEDWSVQWTAADTIRIYIETMVFMYHMTDNTDYADAAIRWANGIALYTSWDDVAANDWTQARMIVAACMAYDGLAGYMEADDRAALLAKIDAEHDLLYEESTHHDWGYYPNHRAYNAAAHLIYGVAAGDADIITQAKTWTQRVFTYAVIGGLKTDGWQFEGANYSLHTFELLIGGLHVLKVSGGTDYFTTYSDFLSNLGYGMMCMVYGSDKLRVQLEDTTGTMSIYARTETVMCPYYKLAAEYSDSYVEWFAENYSKNRFMWDYIWKSSSLSATDPSTALAKYKYFADEGIAVWRDGWNLQTDLVVMFKCKSSRGHSHPWNNGFKLLNNGVQISVGPGYAVSWTEYDETWANNCILVDPEEVAYGGASGGQASEPNDTGTVALGTEGDFQEHASNAFYSYARGVVDDSLYTNDPTANGGYYPTGDLDSWTRHISLVRDPYYLVVFDILAASEVKEFDWCFNGTDLKNAGQAMSMDENNDILTFNVGTETVEIKVLEPASYHYMTELDPGGNINRDFYRAQIHPAVNTDLAYFLNVVFFDSTLRADDAVVTHIDQSNCVGVIVAYTTYKDLILFSRDGAAVSQYIELGGSYRDADGETYTFAGTTVLAAFSNYTVMRLEQGDEVPDTTPPFTSGHSPADLAANVAIDTNIVVHIQDVDAGVDISTIVMTVEGVPVEPVITGTAADYTLTYNPAVDFSYEQVVNVTIDADDLETPANSMVQDVYSFTTIAELISLEITGHSLAVMSEIMGFTIAAIAEITGRPIR